MHEVMHIGIGDVVCALCLSEYTCKKEETYVIESKYLAKAIQKIFGANKEEAKRGIELALTFAFVEKYGKYIVPGGSNKKKVLKSIELLEEKVSRA